MSNSVRPRWHYYCRCGHMLQARSGDELGDAISSHLAEHEQGLPADSLDG